MSFGLRQKPGLLQVKIGDWLRKYVGKTLSGNETTTITYPPPIAKTIGFELVDIGQASATLKMQTDPAIHGNPMGTVHFDYGSDLWEIGKGRICQRKSVTNKLQAGGASNNNRTSSLCRFVFVFAKMLFSCERNVFCVTPSSSAASFRLSPDARIRPNRASAAVNP